MMHSTYDVQRILIWISSPQADKPFTRDTIINHLSPISFSLVDYILDREVEKGSIYQSGPTGKYYMRRDSNMMSDTEKRLSDLEVKYKWLEEVVAKMHYEKPEKKRLWQKYDGGTMMPLFVDVMLANGEVVLNMPCNKVPRKNYPDDSTNVIAWREAKQ